MHGIVVGVDGSQCAQRALNWAMEEAAVTGAVLTVITVNNAMAARMPGQPVPAHGDEAPLEQARQAAQEATAKARSQLRVREKQPARVSVLAVNGSPAKELIDASRDADLLVVGARGHGGFPRLRLGSVSSQVTHHADCPVVVVPA